MWCAQVNTWLPRNPYFLPAGRPLAVSGRFGFGIGFCLADESNVPLSWSWRAAVLLVEPACQVEIVYIQNHHDWCSLSFFSSPSFLFSTAAAVHPDGSQPRSPWSGFFLGLLFCLPPPPPPPASPLWHWDDKSIHKRLGRPSPQHVTLTHWPPPRARGRSATYWKSYEWFNSFIKKRQWEECNIIEKACSSG